MARIDLDEYLFSPGRTRINDFLASLAQRRGVPYQLLVSRIPFGDNGHIRRPRDYMGSAYMRGNPPPSNFKALLYCPWLEKHPELLLDLDGNPHKFLDERLVESCEALVRLGPFLWCPKNRIVPHFIGWPGSGESGLVYRQDHANLTSSNSRIIPWKSSAGDLFGPSTSFSESGSDSDILSWLQKRLWMLAFGCLACRLLVHEFSQNLYRMVCVVVRASLGHPRLFLVSVLATVSMLVTSFSSLQLITLPSQSIMEQPQPLLSRTRH